MGIWQRLRQDLLMAFAGFQEATVAVADRVNRRVQEVKTSIDAGILEKQIEADHALLGNKVYLKGHSDLAVLFKEPELRRLFEKIQEQQKKLSTIETTILPHESWLEFERIFLQSEFLIHHLVISESFHGVGKKIKELFLPPQMRVIFIRKGNRLEMAHGNILVETHDEVIFLCPKVNLQRYIDYWKDS